MLSLPRNAIPAMFLFTKTLVTYAKNALLDASSVVPLLPAVYALLAIIYQVVEHVLLV